MTVLWQLKCYPTPFFFFQFVLLIHLSIYCTYLSCTQLKLKSVFPVEYVPNCSRDTKLRSLPAACGSEDVKPEEAWANHQSSKQIIFKKHAKLPNLNVLLSLGSLFSFSSVSTVRSYENAEKHWSVGQFFVIVFCRATWTISFWLCPWINAVGEKRWRNGIRPGITRPLAVY